MISLTAISSLLCLGSTIGSMLSALSYFRLPLSIRLQDSFLWIIFHMSVANMWMQLGLLVILSFGASFSFWNQASPLSLPLIQKVLLYIPFCSIQNGILDCITMSYILLNASLCFLLHQRIKNIQKKYTSNGNSPLSEQNTHMAPGYHLHPNHNLKNKSSDGTANHVTSNNKYNGSEKRNITILTFASWMIPIIYVYILPLLLPTSFWNLQDNSVMSCEFLESLQQNQQQIQYYQDTKSSNWSFVISFILVILPLVTASYCIYVICRGIYVMKRLKHSYGNMLACENQDKNNNDNNHYDSPTKMTGNHTSYHESPPHPSIYGEANIYARRRTDISVVSSDADQESFSAKKTPKTKFPAWYNFTAHRKKKEQHQQYSSKTKKSRSFSSFASIEVNNNQPHAGLEEMHNIDDYDQLPPDIRMFQQLLFQYIFFPTILIACWTMKGCITVICIHYFGPSLLSQSLISFTSLHYFGLSSILPMSLSGIFHFMIWIYRGPSVVARWKKDYLEVENYTSGGDGFGSGDIDGTNGFLWTEDLEVEEEYDDVGEDHQF